MVPKGSQRSKIQPLLLKNLQLPPLASLTSGCTQKGKSIVGVPGPSSLQGKGDRAHPDPGTRPHGE